MHHPPSKPQDNDAEVTCQKWGGPPINSEVDGTGVFLHWVSYNGADKPGTGNRPGSTP